MGTLDHQIRSPRKGAGRETGGCGKGHQMGSVGFIHQYRNPFLMADAADSFYIRKNPFISGTCQYHRFCSRVSAESSLHLKSTDSAADTPFFIHGRHEPAHPISREPDRMEHCLMTVSGTDHLRPVPGQRPDRCQQSACRAVDQIPGPFRPPQAGSPPHGVRQNPARIMQVICALNLREIPGRRESGCRLHQPFMARHMQRIKALPDIFFQLRL